MVPHHETHSGFNATRSRPTRSSSLVRNCALFTLRIDFECLVVDNAFVAYASDEPVTRLVELLAARAAEEGDVARHRRRFVAGARFRGGGGRPARVRGVDYAPPGWPLNAAAHRQSLTVEVPGSPSKVDASIAVEIAGNDTED